MQRFWMVAAGTLLVFLAIFLVAEALGLPSFFDVQQWIGTPSLPAALLSIVLLIADVLLPIPSVLIMIANGAMFGFALGTLISLIGNLGGALFGFWIGRSNSAWVTRFVSADEMSQVNDLLERWGMLAIIVTRPIPLFGETVTVVAGMSRLSLPQVLLATLLGWLPICALYALTGSYAVSFDSMLLSFGVVLLVASVFWLLRERINRLLV